MERKQMERVMGIEPTRPAWKAGVLPLNYTRTENVKHSKLNPEDSSAARVPNRPEKKT